MCISQQLAIPLRFVTPLVFPTAMSSSKWSTMVTGQVGGD
jgi:hypothetical protein